MAKKMFIEIGLCNPKTHDFKGQVEIYMVKFNVSILNGLKITEFFVKAKYIHNCNVILNKTITKLSTILRKCRYLSPTSYLKINF